MPVAISDLTGGLPVKYICEHIMSPAGDLMDSKNVKKPSMLRRTFTFSEKYIECPFYCQDCLNILDPRNIMKYHLMTDKKFSGHENPKPIDWLTPLTQEMKDFIRAVEVGRSPPVICEILKLQKNATRQKMVTECRASERTNYFQAETMINATHRWQFFHKNFNHQCPGFGPLQCGICEGVAEDILMKCYALMRKRIEQYERRIARSSTPKTLITKPEPSSKAPSISPPAVNLFKKLPALTSKSKRNEQHKEELLARAASVKHHLKRFGSSDSDKYTDLMKESIVQADRENEAFEKRIGIYPKYEDVKVAVAPAAVAAKVVVEPTRIDPALTEILQKPQQIAEAFLDSMPSSFTVRSGRSGPPKGK